MTLSTRLFNFASFLPLLAATTGDGVSVSVGGIVVGLLLAALVYIVAVLVLGLVSVTERFASAVALLLALLVFVLCAFDF